MGKTKSRTPAAPLTDDAWVTSAAERKRRCAVCNDVALESSRAVLRLINEKQAWSISLDKIYTRVCDLNEGFSERVRAENFRAHLDKHEPLWHRYKGDTKK